MGVDLYDDFAALTAARAEMDEEILAWARGVTPEWLAEPMTWTSRLYGFTQTHPRWVQVVQMFNHQTHHRGQAHALLTAAGVDIGGTDVPMLPAAGGLATMAARAATLLLGGRRPADGRLPRRGVGRADPRRSAAGTRS